MTEYEHEALTSADYDYIMTNNDEPEEEFDWMEDTDEGPLY